MKEKERLQSESTSNRENVAALWMSVLISCVAVQ